jgi:hypothetical protein
VSQIQPGSPDHHENGLDLIFMNSLRVQHEVDIPCNITRKTSLINASIIASSRRRIQERHKD